MTGNSLREILRPELCGPVAFVGAGGKSSGLARLGREVRLARGKVILSVTTRLGIDQGDLADRRVICRGRLPGDFDPRAGESLLLTGPDLTGQEKIEGLSPEILRQAARAFPGVPLIIEADGAGGAELKVPGESEPVIPDFCRTVVAVTAFSALDAAGGECRIHRRERFQALFGEVGRLDASLFAALLAHRAGSFKGAPSGARRVWCINGADTPEERAAAANFASRVLDIEPAAADLVVIGALRGGGELQSLNPSRICEEQGSL